MIKDRPDALVADKRYVRPALPYALDWGPVPELVRASIADLGGAQPITGKMAAAAGGRMFDVPSEAEQAYFRERGTSFQMISIVASTVHVESRGGVSIVTPFALSLIPASKRGEVTTADIDHVTLVAGTDVENGLIYQGYDPFAGEWSLYGPASLLAAEGKGFLDEVGLVVGRYFLATEFDPDDVLMLDVGMPTARLRTKYHQRRQELMFRPFRRLEARRVWGAESPIELFLIQFLAMHGLHPAIQMLIMDDGSTYPSWYHLWKDLEVRHAAGLITEADLYFPDARMAVFCDGSHHQRGKQKLKDELIVARLAELGIRSVRLPGALINGDIESAGRTVIKALDRQ